MDYQNMYLKERQRNNELQGKIEAQDALKDKQQRAVERIGMVLDEALALAKMVQSFDVENPTEIEQRKREMGKMIEFIIRAQKDYNDILK